MITATRCPGCAIAVTHKPGCQDANGAQGSPLDCEHANESPRGECRCADGCYCRNNTCLGCSGTGNRLCGAHKCRCNRKLEAQKTDDYLSDEECWAILDSTPYSITRKEACRAGFNAGRVDMKRTVATLNAEIERQRAVIHEMVNEPASANGKALLAERDARIAELEADAARAEVWDLKNLLANEHKLYADAWAQREEAVASLSERRQRVVALEVELAELHAELVKLHKRSKT